MSKGKHFLDRLTENADLLMEPIPGQPIVEIAGDRRVLIENHFGVKVYGQEKIVVKVRYGHVCVGGCGLELLRMNREQLVIRGKIQCVSLQRKDLP